MFQPRRRVVLETEQKASSSIKGVRGPTKVAVAFAACRCGKAWLGSSKGKPYKMSKCGLLVSAKPSMDSSLCCSGERNEYIRAAPP